MNREMGMILNEDRNCNTCIFHASGQCQKWDCNFISVAEAVHAIEQMKTVGEILRRK